MTNLTEEKTELLEKYFEAMGFFYYIIPLKKYMKL